MSTLPPKFYRRVFARPGESPMSSKQSFGSNDIVEYINIDNVERNVDELCKVSEFEFEKVQNWFNAIQAVHNLAKQIKQMATDQKYKKLHTTKIQIPNDEFTDVLLTAEKTLHDYSFAVYHIISTLSNSANNAQLLAACIVRMVNPSQFMLGKNGELPVITYDKHVDHRFSQKQKEAEERHMKQLEQIKSILADNEQKQAITQLESLITINKKYREGIEERLKEADSKLKESTIKAKATEEQANANLRATEEKYKLANAKLREVETRMQEVETRLQELETKSSELDEKNKQLYDTQKSAEEKVKLADEKIRMADEKNKLADRNLRDVKQTTILYDINLSKANAEIDRLRNLLMQSHPTILESDDAINQLREEIIKLRNQNLMLTAQIVTEKSTINKLEDALVTVNERLKEYTNAFASMMSRQEESKKEVEAEKSAKPSSKKSSKRRGRTPAKSSKRRNVPSSPQQSLPSNSPQHSPHSNSPQHSPPHDLPLPPAIPPAVMPPPQSIPYQ